MRKGIESRQRMGRRMGRRMGKRMGKRTRGIMGREQDDIY